MNNYLKRIVRYGILQGGIFIIALTAICYWIKGNEFFTALTVGVIGGVIVGILNSLLFFKYAVPKYVLDAVSVDIDVDETLIFQTPAKYTGEQEPLSGKLFLTDKRLIFKNHKHDKNIDKFSINLVDINKVEKFKTLQFFENGLRVHTASTMKHKFVVDNLKQWLLHFDTRENGLQHGDLAL